MNFVMFLWNIIVCATVCPIWIHFTAAQATDITLICPRSFRNGTISIIRATFLTANVAKCDLGPVSSVIFRLTKRGGSTDDICTLTYPACDRTVNSQGCRCVDYNATKYEYELNFVFDTATHSGGSLDLRPFGCFTFSPYPFTHTTCNNLTETASNATPELPRRDDFTLICPADDYFVNGQNYTLRCEVNGTALDAERCLSLNRVRLEILAADNTPTLLAESSYPACDTNWTGNARCASKDPVTNIYVYEFWFTTDNATQQGKSLRCWSNCIPSGGHNATIKLTASTCTLEIEDCCALYLLLLLLLLLLPLPIPSPWPGYPIYVVLCRIPSQGSSTDSPQPDNWHPHYMCCRRTNNVYFSACCVTNDGRVVLIWSKSPTTGRFVCYGTETIPDNNRNNEDHAGNGDTRSSQQEKTQHTGTGGSPRKSRQPEASVELTTVRTSSPPQAATVHGDNQASGTPHDHDQPSTTSRLRPLPKPSRLTSVERNSSMETPNTHPKLPPIGKPDNQPTGKQN